MAITEAGVDLHGLLADLGRWLHRVRILQADLEFAGWRHEQEAGALLKVLLDARGRAEEARLLEPERRASALRQIVNALPAARLRQLEVHAHPGDEAA